MPPHKGFNMLEEKAYRCSRCGHTMMILTNHYENCWSWGHINCCPACPPYAKYPEFGGRTDWICLEAKVENVLITLPGI